MTPRTSGWILFPILNGEHCYSYFLVFISGTRGEKYLSTLKVLMLAWWEFSKDTTYIILLECPSVFVCLTPLEVVSYQLKSHSCRSLMNMKEK